MRGITEALPLNGRRTGLAERSTTSGCGVGGTIGVREQDGDGNPIPAVSWLTSLARFATLYPAPRSRDRVAMPLRSAQKMKKALMITVVVILAVVGGILPFINGMMIWDGSVFVPIAVSVFDDDRRPVVGASVSLILPRDTEYYGGISEDEYREILLSDQRIFETDELGTGSLGGRFPAGGRYGTFKKRGRYTLDGDILIVHPDFQEFRVSLRNLLQASEFSIDESELELVAFLEPTKAEHNAAGKGLQPSLR